LSFLNLPEDDSLENADLSSPKMRKEDATAQSASASDVKDAFRD